MLLYHHTKACAANDTLGQIFCVVVSLQKKLTCEIDNQPLFYVPKSIALNSIKDWKDNLDIRFPVSSELSDSNGY
jgi:hypothetical protein